MFQPMTSRVVALRPTWPYFVALVLPLAAGYVAASSRGIELFAGFVVILFIAAANIVPRFTLVVSVVAMAYPYSRSPDVPKLGVGVAMVIGLLLIVAYSHRMTSLRLNLLDWAVIAFAVTPAMIMFVEAIPVPRTIWLAPAITFPYFGFRLLFQDRRARDLFPAAVVALGTVLGALGVYEALSGRNPFVAPATQKYIDGQTVTTWDIPLHRAGLLRAASTFGHPIAFGMFLLIPLAFAMSRSGWRYAVATWVILAGEAATLSRGPWLGAIAIIVLLSGLSGRRALAIGGCAVIAATFGPIHKLLTNSSDTTAAHNAHYRVGLLQQAFHHVTLAGNPTIDITKAIPNYSDVTSLVAVTSVRTGAIGLTELAALAYLAVSALRRARRSDDRNRKAGTAALIGLLIGLLAVTLITSFQFYLWVVAAYVAASYRTRTTSRRYAHAPSQTSARMPR